MECLNHKQLAAALGLSIGTIRNNWKCYPHFFITPKGWEKPNLKAARFDLNKVLDHCQKQSETEVFRNAMFQGIQQTGGEMGGLLQIQRENIQSCCTNKERRKGMANIKGKGIKKENQEIRDFDVF